MMRKKAFWLGLLLGLACMGLARAEYIMTWEEMDAIYADSCERMRTTYDTENLLTSRDFDLEAFEKEYTAQTGLARKEDLLISSLPKEGDMSYDAALSYARELIFQTFGTPAAELDAMGVYPELIEFVYLDHQSEWAFYFTPRTDTEIMLDHEYDAPGEYRIHFGAQNGEVELCAWYIDDFWPDYAQRTWDAGLRDYVFERAGGKDFYTQSQEMQAWFLKAFREAGYDVEGFFPSEEELLGSLKLDLLFCDPAETLLGTDDPYLPEALRALEAEYGLTLSELTRFAFTATYSPLQRDTVDICFAYNYDIEAARQEEGTLDRAKSTLFSYARRVGTFMVCIDPETGKAVRVVHGPNEPAREEDASLPYLRRRNWTMDDFRAFEALYTEWEKVLKSAPSMNGEEWEGFVDSFMRRAGADPDLYTGTVPDEMPYGEAEATAIAREAAIRETGMTPEAFDAWYGPAFCHYDGVSVYYVNFVALNWNEPDGDPWCYTVPVDANTGETGEISRTEGLG